LATPRARSFGHWQPRAQSLPPLSCRAPIHAPVAPVGYSADHVAQNVEMVRAVMEAYPHPEMLGSLVNGEFDLELARRSNGTHHA